MVDISENEAVLVENALTKTLDLISEDESDEGMALKQMLVEAQQIMSAKIDGNAAGETTMQGPSAI